MDSKTTEPKAIRIDGAKKTSKKKKHIVRNIILILLVVVLGGVGAWYFISAMQAEYVVNYQPYTVTTGTISNSLSFSGTLQAVNNTAYTAESEADVREVYVSEGDTVKEGDYIMRLSTGQLIEAEFDGKVDTVSVAEDDHVNAGAALCQIVDFTHQKVSFRVDEYDINDVHVGDACRITTTATEQTFESVIKSISHVSASTGNVAYYTAVAYVDVSDGVYPGMQVTVTVPKEEAVDVVILKADAISFDDNNKAFVYTLDESGNVSQTYITTGVSNGNYVEIKDGLKDGDTVYTVVEQETDTVSNMFAGLFGGQRIMGGNMGGGADRGTGGSRNMEEGGFNRENMGERQQNGSERRSEGGNNGGGGR